MSIQQGATNAFKTGLMDNVYDFTSGSFKIALYTGSANIGPDTAAYTAGMTGEVVASGYTAGGAALTVSQTPTTGGTGTTAYISFSNVTFNAALTARGALIYQVGTPNSSVCVLDFGSDKTSTSTFTVQFPSATNTSAIIRIA
jgi:hypothetical protein